MAGRTPTPESIAQDLAAVAGRLRAAREFRGLGSRELGELAGLSEATVSSIEGGRVKGLEVATAFKLADALRVRRAWLLTGDGVADESAALSPSKK